jgi:hypothetical protein
MALTLSGRIHSSLVSQARAVGAFECDASDARLGGGGI